MVAAVTEGFTDRNSQKQKARQRRAFCFACNRRVERRDSRPLQRGEIFPVRRAAPHPKYQYLYADSPCEVVSNPSRSSSSGTRSPTIRSAILKAMNAATAVHTNVMPTPLA